MSKKFYAVHRETGERWKPDLVNNKHQYLVMYDSGYLAVVSIHKEYRDFWSIHPIQETTITPLNTKIWKIVDNRLTPKQD